MKPLFIPLKAQFYDAFARGEKTSELRKHGDRWNAKVCEPGRLVVLSRGYGRANRMRGVINQVSVGSLQILNEAQRASILDIYQDPSMVVIAIGITLMANAECSQT